MNPKPRSEMTFLTVPVATVTSNILLESNCTHGPFEKEGRPRGAPPDVPTVTRFYPTSRIRRGGVRSTLGDQSNELAGELDRFARREDRVVEREALEPGVDVRPQRLGG